MKINNRQQLLIIAAVVVVALFAGDRIILSPLSNLWSARSKEIKKLQTDVTNAKSLARQEQRLRSRWDEMRRNTLPDSQLAQQQVLQAFDRWARETGVTVTSVNPQRHEGDDYSTLQCRVEGSGSLAKVTQFLYAMEKDPMALRFENIELSTHDNEGQVIAIGLQVSGLILPATTKKP